MSDLKPELSKKSKYWIPKERYLELQHFCKQYDDWKFMLRVMDGHSRKRELLDFFCKTNDISDPVFAEVEIRQHYNDKVELIDNICRETDSDLAYFINLGVTKGISYNYMYAKLDIPCSRDTYYDRYRKFFWLLNKIRD